MEGTIIYLVLLIAIFYFLLIRPQQKQRQQRQELIDSLRVGQEVVTIGGLYGVIKAIRNDTVILEVAENIELEFQKNSVAFRPIDKADKEDEEDEVDEGFEDNNDAEDYDAEIEADIEEALEEDLEKDSE